jgi:hypothetical protein
MVPRASRSRQWHQDLTNFQNDMFNHRHRRISATRYTLHHVREVVYQASMAFLRRRHMQNVQASVDAIGEDNRRWLTDQSMRHGKVRPHRVVSSAIRLASKNEEGIWTTVYAFCGNAGGCVSRCPRPVWIRSRARLSHSVGRGRFPKSPALRLMRTRWGFDGGGDGLCWCE